MKYKFTVVIPVLQMAEYDLTSIRRGIDSILEQTIGKEHLELHLLSHANDEIIDACLQQYASEYSEHISWFDCNDIDTGFVKYETLKLAEGKYTVFFDPMNYWDADAFEEAYRYFEEAPEWFDVALCNETLIESTSAKSTFRFLYKSGNRMTNILEEPRDVVVSLNNAVFRTSAFKYAVVDRDLKYGNELYFITSILMRHPKLGVIATARFDYCNSEQLSSLYAEYASDYLHGLRNLTEKLKALSIGRFDEVIEYVQNLMLYDMRQIVEGANVAHPFSAAEQEAYRAFIREQLLDIDSDLIDEAPGTTQYQRLGIFVLKYGDDVLTQSEYVFGRLEFHGHRILNLKGNIVKMHTMRIRDGHIQFTGETSAFPMNVKSVLYVKDEKGQRIDAVMETYRDAELDDRFGHPLLKGKRFSFDIPVHDGQKLALYVRYNDDELKVEPVYGIDIPLTKKSKKAFFIQDGYIIHQNGGKIHITAESWKTRLLHTYRYWEELKNKKNPNSLNKWKNRRRNHRNVQNNKLKNQIAFVSARADGELLPNIQCVYDQVEAKKVVFARMMPYDENDWKEAVQTVYQSKVVVTDDYSFILRRYGKKPGQKVVQLWHAAGAFKKFGLDGTNIFPEVDKLYHENYDLVAVSSEEVRPIYANAFGIDVQKVSALGTPRTDLLMDETYRSRVREQIYSKYPTFRDKQIIVYAPTFRDIPGRDRRVFIPDIDFESLSAKLQPNQIFVICPHPIFKNRIIEKHYDNIMQMKAFTTNEMMCIADLLVTDYSSVIFEFALFDKPMAFYCYDYDSYDRDFYLDYETELPGELIRDYSTLESYLASGDFHLDERMVQFREKYMSACDGKSAARIARTLENML